MSKNNTKRRIDVPVPVFHPNKRRPALDYFNFYPEVELRIDRLASETEYRAYHRIRNHLVMGHAVLASESGVERYGGMRGSRSAEEVLEFVKQYIPVKDGYFWEPHMEEARVTHVYRQECGRLDGIESGRVRRAKARNT